MTIDRAILIGGGRELTPVNADPCLSDCEK